MLSSFRLKRIEMPACADRPTRTGGEKSLNYAKDFSTTVEKDAISVYSVLLEL